MGYMHIDNLYKNQTILSFRECFAMEKIHGTSAFVQWSLRACSFSPGGENYYRFKSLFAAELLEERFASIGHESMVIYGEAYGGSQQAQSHRYGTELRFVAFEVSVGGVWLAVPQAQSVAKQLGLEFVHYTRIPTTLEAINAERDAPSEQARRNGVVGEWHREGIVLRPPFEVRLNNGDRVIAKHKRDDQRETRSPRQVLDPAQLVVLKQANAIAEEWVTPTRLSHVLDKLGCVSIEQTRELIAAMIEDVAREGAGEFVDSREARTAIGKRAAQLFHAKLKAENG